MITTVGSALRSPLARILLLGALVIALQVPACMIGDLARAREASRDEAVADVTAHWGAAQHVIGPFVVVPYAVPGKDGKGRPIVAESGQVVFTPERLDIRADAAPEVRRRGLFEVPVYRATVRLAGRFRALQPDARAVDARAVLHWERADFVVRLADARALDEVSAVRWGGRELAVEPGTSWLPGSGLQAALGTLVPGAPADFEVALALRGSGGLSFAPMGLETAARLASPWPHPSFTGAWLPLRHAIGAQGFTASWNVPFVARGMPAAWKHGYVSEEDLQRSLFGSRFLAPVDPYRMSERSLKYWPLFIGLAFLVLWLFEVLGHARVHSVQYLLLGAALCLFYLVELSLAEHIGHARAYALASAAVTVQAGLYSRTALGGWRPLAVAGIIATLYALLYVLLREEDYALLVGSASLFAILSAVMFLTRKLRWGGAAPDGA